MGEALMSRSIVDSEVKRKAETEGLLTINFDDEPLEHILYGEGDGSPTIANLYLTGIVLAHNLADACGRRDWPAIDTTVEQLCDMDIRLSYEQHSAIAAAISPIVPECPKPLPLQFDAARAVDLLERIWAFAIAQNNKLLQGVNGPNLLRLYEYLGRNEQAGIIAGSLLEYCREEGNRRAEASGLNNMGFTLLLEERWAKAMPFFEQAAEIYSKLGVEVNNANSLCNYWHCRVELGDWGDVDETRALLDGLTRKMKCHISWYERKPLILLARLEEHLGNYSKAVSLLRKAIKSALLSGTTYPEEDRRYLNRFLEKWKGTRRRRGQ
jgi:tetratricopeptide (TPR) repeat protein